MFAVLELVKKYPVSLKQLLKLSKFVCLFMRIFTRIFWVLFHKLYSGLYYRSNDTSIMSFMEGAI